MGRKKEGRKEVKGGWNELMKEGRKEGSQRRIERRRKGRKEAKGGIEME